MLLSPTSFHTSPTKGLETPQSRIRSYRTIIRLCLVQGPAKLLVSRLDERHETWASCRAPCFRTTPKTK